MPEIPVRSRPGSSTVVKVLVFKNIVKGTLLLSLNVLLTVKSRQKSSGILFVLLIAFLVKYAVKSYVN